MVFGVQPEVSGHKVNVPIKVNITGGDAVPPAGVLGKTGTLGYIGEFPFVVLQVNDWSPFKGYQQVLPAIVIDIRKHGSGHEAGPAEGRGELFRGISKPAFCINQQAACSRVGVLPGNQAATDKQV